LCATKAAIKMLEKQQKGVDLNFICWFSSIHDDAHAARRGEGWMEGLGGVVGGSGDGLE
jgi:hypothetical protein